MQPYNIPPIRLDQVTLKTVFFGLVWVLPCEGDSSAGCKHRARRPEEGSDSPPTPTKHWLKFTPLMMIPSFVLIHFSSCYLCACIPPDVNNNQKKSPTDKPPATTIVVKKVRRRNLENRGKLRKLQKLRKSSRDSGVIFIWFLDSIKILFLGFNSISFYLFWGFYTLCRWQFLCSRSTV